MNIEIIAAISPKNVIGANGKLPWNLPEDLALFKKSTTGQTVIMGKNTFNSLKGALPDRTNIVITDKKLNVKNIIESGSLVDALNTANMYKQKIFIIGGAQLYAATIDIADILHISHVKKDVNGDKFFPKIDMNVWQCIEEKNYKDFVYKKYIRK